MKKFLRIQEAAQFLGCSTSTLRNWDKQKKLLPDRHPINNYRVYRIENLEALILDLKPKLRVRKLKIKIEE